MKIHRHRCVYGKCLLICSTDYTEKSGFVSRIFNIALKFSARKYALLNEYPVNRMCSSNVKPRVVELYKTLLHLGKDYPKGFDYFHAKLKSAFLKNKDVKDPKEIEMLLARGQYVVKELEALYSLKKYRTLKERYYKD